MSKNRLEDDEIFSGLKLKKSQTLYGSNDPLAYSKANFNEPLLQSNDKIIRIKDNSYLNIHAKTNNMICLKGDNDDFSVTNEEEI